MRQVLVPHEVDLGLPPGGSTLFKTGGQSMGTSWSASLMLPPGAQGAAITTALQHELDQIVAQMSHWDASSLLSQYNQAAPGSWHALPAQFFDVASYAFEIAADSSGAYDPAGGALVNLWGFGPRKRFDQPDFYAPTAAAIASVLTERAGQAPTLDRAARRLLQPGGVQLDFSSCAKGYAVDCMARRLEQLSIRHYVVEAGGELRGAGIKANGEPWWVEVEGVPDAMHQSSAPLVALHGLAIATSGDYRRFFKLGTQRASHTLDPRNGQPVANDVASATVLAPSCLEADVLSTTLTVLGPESGLAFANARGIAARFLVRRPGGLHETCSDAWRSLLQ